jgi:hypothetical protein
MPCSPRMRQVVARQRPRQRISSAVVRSHCCLPSGSLSNEAAERGDRNEQPGRQGGDRYRRGAWSGACICQATRWPRRQCRYGGSRSAVRTALGTRLCPPWRAAIERELAQLCSGSQKLLLAHRQPQARQQQLAVLGVPKVADDRHHAAGNGAQPLDNLSCVVEPTH